MQCHFLLCLHLSATFFFVHSDHAPGQRVHAAQRNSACGNPSNTTNTHVLRLRNRWHWPFCILPVADSMFQSQLELLPSLGHRVPPPHTSALTRSLPLPPLLWTPQHLLPHSQVKGGYQAAQLFWEVSTNRRQWGIGSVVA